MAVTVYINQFMCVKALKWADVAVKKSVIHPSIQTTNPKGKPANLHTREIKNTKYVHSNPQHFPFYLHSLYLLLKALLVKY